MLLYSAIPFCDFFFTKFTVIHVLLSNSPPFPLWDSKLKYFNRGLSNHINSSNERNSPQTKMECLGLDHVQHDKSLSVLDNMHKPTPECLDQSCQGENHNVSKEK